MNIFKVVIRLIKIVKVIVRLTKIFKYIFFISSCTETYKITFFSAINYNIGVKYTE